MTNIRIVATSATTWMASVMLSITEDLRALPAQSIRNSNAHNISSGPVFA